LKRFKYTAFEGRMGRLAPSAGDPDPDPDPDAWGAGGDRLDKYYTGTQLCGVKYGLGHCLDTSRAASTAY